MNRTEGKRKRERFI